MHWNNTSGSLWTCSVKESDWNESNLRASHAIILYLRCKVTRVRAEDIACFIKCDAREKKK